MKKLLLSVFLLTFLGAKAQEKNVLFIIVDDLKPMIQAMGQEQMITPNLDRLVDRSVTFTNAPHPGLAS